MPLKKGHSREVISDNIKEMIKSGHKPVQAVAAALANSRKYKKMWKGGMAEGGELMNMDYEKNYEEDEQKEENRAGMASGGDVSQDTLGSMIGYPGFPKPKPKGMASGGMVDKLKNRGQSGPEMESVQARRYAAGGTVQDVQHGGMSDMQPLVDDDHGKGGDDESLAEMDRKGPEDYMRSLNEIRYDGEYYPDEVANPNEQNEAREFAMALRRRAQEEMGPEHSYAEGGLVQDGPEEDQRLHGNRPEYIINDGTEAPMDTMPMKPDGLEYKPKERDPSGPGLSEEARKAILMKKKSRRYGVYDPKA